MAHLAYGVHKITIGIIRDLKRFIVLEPSKEQILHPALLMIIDNNYSWAQRAQIRLHQLFYLYTIIVTHFHTIYASFKHLLK